MDSNYVHRRQIKSPYCPKKLIGSIKKKSRLQLRLDNSELLYFRVVQVLR